MLVAKHFSIGLSLQKKLHHFNLQDRERTMHYHIPHVPIISTSFPSKIGWSLRKRIQLKGCLSSKNSQFSFNLTQQTSHNMQTAFQGCDFVCWNWDQTLAPPLQVQLHAFKSYTVLEIIFLQRLQRFAGGSEASCTHKPCGYHLEWVHYCKSFQLTCYPLYTTAF